MSAALVLADMHCQWQHDGGCSRLRVGGTCSMIRRLKLDQHGMHSSEVCFKHARQAANSMDCRAAVSFGPGCTPFPVCDKPALSPSPP